MQLDEILDGTMVWRVSAATECLTREWYDLTSAATIDHHADVLEAKKPATFNIVWAEVDSQRGGGAMLQCRE
ncbi:hypothetical protein CVT26_008635 [Gymnopilus dilepis]|uniref:Uncharacterized protein n=1 Tax=Gymnopilus dilepis TaxID=231916 RepID=A0A409XY02_9AGAR|nr:hypothetical protein CVT26_008635 [Gymnopilus dilepis]